MNPKTLMNPSRKYVDMIFLVYPRSETKIEKQKLGCLGMPFQVYLKMKFLPIPLIKIIAKST